MMIIIFVLLLIAGLLSLLCFIYFRFRSNNRDADAVKRKDSEPFPQPGSSRIIVKKGNHTIIKTTGSTDEKQFFHDN